MNNPFLTIAVYLKPQQGKLKKCKVALHRLILRILSLTQDLVVQIKKKLLVIKLVTPFFMLKIDIQLRQLSLCVFQYFFCVLLLKGKTTFSVNTLLLRYLNINKQLNVKWKRFQTGLYNLKLTIIMYLWQVFFYQYQKSCLYTIYNNVFCEAYFTRVVLRGLIPIVPKPLEQIF